MSKLFHNKNLLGAHRSVGVLMLFVPAILLTGLVFSPGYAQEAASDSEEDYDDLWKRGAYREALDALHETLSSFGEYTPIQGLEDRSALHFEVGEVDEAIKDMEELSGLSRSPVHDLKLAELFRYRGRLDEYEAALARASARLNAGFYYRDRVRSFLALGRIAELGGEDPKQILSLIYKVQMERSPNDVRAFVAAGELALRKGSYDLASRYYTDGLKVDEDSQEAMAGLAECFWESGDPRLAPVLTRLLEANPNHPRGRAIEVEQLLDAGKSKEAIKAIDKALGVNPNSLRFRALKSAALFLEDDLEAMEKLQSETLDFNPVCSEVFRVPGRIASRHYRFEEGANFQSRACELDENDHEARALLAFDLLRSGREEAGREELEKAFMGDPYNVQVFNMLTALDTLKTFALMNEGPFALQMPKEEAPILANDMLSLLHEAIELYERKYAINLEKPVYVQVFDNHDDFMVRSVGLPGNAGHLGICFGRLVTMDSPTARPKGSINWRSVLWHEFMHVITLQKTKNRMPRWLSEGISVYEEKQRDPSWGGRMGPEYKAFAANEELPGVEDLEIYFVQPETPQHLMFGYFLAGEFVAFYVEEFGFDALRESLDLIGGGGKCLEALAEAADSSTRKMNRKFKAHLKERFEPYSNLPPALTNEGMSGHELDNALDVLVHAEPSPFIEAMKRALEAFKDERWEDAGKELKGAHKLFPEYTGADGPLPMLAAVYEELDDGPGLEETLKKLLWLDPADFAACQKLAQMYRDKGRWSDLNEVAGLAMGIDPFDVEMRRMLLEAQINDENLEPALETLDVMAQLDRTNADDYRIRQSEIQLELGQLSDAKRNVILVLEKTPHYWKAQELLLSVIERENDER